ncbi:response regulator [Lentibacillus juripiscarius]|uniref:Heme response regulator HssR n=1 Tax=Lentibacillus juripiscarius TaxID=257446 RepID=A0ABW5V2N3_9BACI
MTALLAVDDDERVLNLIEIYMQREGFTVYKAADGTEALSILETKPVDLAIVDVMMPGMDGIDVMKEMKENYELPVILLTAKGELSDKEEGFRSGTDDYVVKPFEPKELLFRVRAILRRYDKPSDTVIRIGDVIIDRRSYEVQIGSRTMLLPLKEFELLAMLASNPNQVFTRDQLIESIWGLDFEGDDRTVNVHIKRIRERVAHLTDAIAIKTVRGVGYRLEVLQE